jgi:hypothetical protein
MRYPMAVLDMKGDADDTIPANISSETPHHQPPANYQPIKTSRAEAPLLTKLRASCFACLRGSLFCRWVPRWWASRLHVVF